MTILTIIFSKTRLSIVFSNHLWRPSFISGSQFDILGHGNVRDLFYYLVIFFLEISRVLCLLGMLCAQYDMFCGISESFYLDAELEIGLQISGVSTNQQIFKLNKSSSRNFTSDFNQLLSHLDIVYNTIELVIEPFGHSYRVIILFHSLDEW